MLTQDNAASDLKTLNRALDAGLPSFVAEVKADKLTPPQIHSEWYVSEIPPSQTDRIALERQKRQFGARLLEVLDRTSEEILGLKDSPSRERIATTLLDLGDWIAERPGYGNAFIFDRCQDMATVPLAHLVADLSYPEARLDRMTARLRNWADMGRMLADALNSELPQPVFTAAQGKTVSEVQKPLGQAWAAGIRRAHEWLKASGSKRDIPVGEDVRATLPPDLRFFCDDMGIDGTTSERWGYKGHGVLALGLARMNVRHLESFALFRKKVGKFPTEPPSWWKPGDTFFDTPIKAAFDQAWEPYRKELGPVYGTAASVYITVNNNTFFDVDTQTRNRHLRRAQWDAARGAPPSSGAPLTRPAGRSIRIELPGTRPASQPTTRPAKP